MKKLFLRVLFLFVACFLGYGHKAFATPAGLTYQGRLVKNNLPVESSSVTLTVKVTSPDANQCVLFEESHTLNMTNSDGIFSIKIGGGARTSNDVGFTLAQVFSNRATALNSLTCLSGATSYTPTLADSRNVYASFNDGTDTVAFAQPYVIQSVPYAIEAERLAGRTASEYLQTTTDTTQTKLNDVMAPTAFTELLALINGTSSQYAKTASGSFTSDVSLNSHKITGLLTPTAATDAANKSYVDGYVGGEAADTTTLTALAAGDSGKVLSWTGTQWTAAVPSADSTKLALTGGTMSGSIAMGANNITGIGYVTQNPGKYFQVGNFDDAGEATMAGSLLPTHKGATWYNTTSSELKYWDGTLVKTMSTSFANQAANQVFAGPGSGANSAPNFRSLVEADIPQLTAASKVLNSATTATSANTASAIVARDASGNFVASDVSLNKTLFKDTGSNTVTLQAPTTVTTSYVLKLPAATVAGDAGKVLSTDAAGQLSWIAAATGSVTSVGATAPIASSGGATPTISIAKSDASTNGYLAAADFTVFNNKQSTALPSANIWVGNGSGVATAVSASGDVSLVNTGAFTVTGIRGKTVSSTLPTASGQILRYDGTSTYLPAFLSLADIRSTVVPGNTMYPASSCTAAQTMTWSSLTDTMSCTTIAVTDSQITYASQAANKFLASPSGAAGAPTYRAIASADLPVTGAGGAIINGGNTFGAASSIGNTDAFDLALKTNNTTRMTILSGGNVGIGTTTPTSPLQVTYSNSAAFGSNHGVQILPTYVQSGTAAANDLYINRTETSVGSGTQNLILAQVGGVDRFYVSRLGVMFLYNTANIYGGLNVYYPATVGKGVYNSASSTDLPFFINPTYTQSGTSSTIDLKINRVETSLGSGTHSFADWQVSGTTKFRVSNTGNGYYAGNVGVGTTSPAYKLDVAGDTNVGSAAAVTPQLTINGGSSGTDLVRLVRTSGATLTYGWSLAGSKMSFNNVTSTKTTLQTSYGAVVAGTSEVNVGFDYGVAATNAGDPGLLKGSDSGLGASDLAGGDLYITPGRGVGAATPSKLYFQTPVATTSGTTRQLLSTKMTIDGSGNVGIGTTGPSGKLEVNSGAAGATTGLIINTTSVGANTYEQYKANGTVIGSITSAAGANVAFNTTSDVRLKGGFQQVASPLKTLNQIEVSNFYYLLDPTHRQDGFKAQQLYQVLPYAVTKPEQEEDEDGKIVPWLADYSKVVPLVTAAVQELYKHILGVDREIASLKSENAELKANDEAKSKEMAEKSKEIFEMKARLDKLEKTLSSK